MGDRGPSWKNPGSARRMAWPSSGRTSLPFMYSLINSSPSLPVPAPPPAMPVAHRPPAKSRWDASGSLAQSAPA
eukprot:3431614-Alexandrium_andersonii.AAC.1